MGLMISKTCDDILSSLSQLTPIPTDAVDSGEMPAGIKAVLFDVYGTLIISGSGDISIASRQQGAFGLSHLLEALNYGKNLEWAARRIPSLMENFIKERHKELQRDGIDNPEVEIRDIWRKILKQLWEDGLLDTLQEEVPTDMLAMGYEIEVNPVWNMPGYPQIVTSLSNAGFRVGIVSNAQFYTPIIMEKLAGKSLKEIGFEEELCAWSYKISRAKPSPEIFTAPLEKLKDAGISPNEVLYVGNDMLNDVYAASRAGCRTCLFAGDKRSLRIREGDVRACIVPDVTITRLTRLETLIGA